MYLNLNLVRSEEHVCFEEIQCLVDYVLFLVVERRRGTSERGFDRQKRHVPDGAMTLRETRVIRLNHLNNM